MTRPILLTLLLLLATSPSWAAEGGPSWIITGNERVDSSELERVARRYLTKLGKTGRDTFAEDAAFEMRNFLLAQGYALADVELELSGPRPEFRVKEGPRVLLGDVTVTGSRVADPEDLAAFVDAPTTWYLGLGSRLLVPVNLDAAASGMGAWLRQRGYLDVEVEGPMTEPSLDELADRKDLPEEIRVDVSYSVRDGPRATLVEIDLEVKGARWYRRELLGEITRLLGRPWTPYSQFRIQSLLTDHLAERGYPFAIARVEPAFLALEDRVEVSVTVSVVTGPIGRIGNVTIRGNKRTKDHVIRRELDFAPGMIVSSVDIRESQRNLFDLGFFRQAGIEIEETMPRDEIRKKEEVVLDLDIFIEETELRRLDFSLGYGSWEKFRGSVSYTIFNVLASGVDLTTELALSTKNISGLVRVTDPWFITPRIRGTAEILVEQEERPTFKYNRERVTLGLSRRFERQHELYTRWSLSRTNVFEVSGDLPKEFENTTSVSSITLGAISDTRKSKWIPVKGQYLAASVEWASDAIGSEIDFIRPRASAAGYRRTFFDIVFAWRTEFEITVPIGTTDAMPVQERFYLGGSQTVRSFSQDDLGPRAVKEKADGRLVRTSSASGGEFYSLANVELRIPLIGGLETAAFADMGNVVRFHDDPKFRDYRFAVGTGLRFRTPLGPIRVDWGFNPNPRWYEDDWAIYLAVGYPF